MEQEANPNVNMTQEIEAKLSQSDIYARMDNS